MPRHQGPGHRLRLLRCGARSGVGRAAADGGHRGGPRQRQYAKDRQVSSHDREPALAGAVRWGTAWNEWVTSRRTPAHRRAVSGVQSRRRPVSARTVHAWVLPADASDGGCFSSVVWSRPGRPGAARDACSAALPADSRPQRCRWGREADHFERWRPFRAPTDVDRQGISTASTDRSPRSLPCSYVVSSPPPPLLSPLSPSAWSPPHRPALISVRRRAGQGWVGALVVVGFPA